MRLTRSLRLGLALLTLGALGAPALAQADSDLIGPPTALVERPQPRLVVDEPVIRLGKIANDRIAEAVLHFRNAGDGPLQMSPIRCSCGCTAAKLAKTVFAPGESGEVVIHFDPKGKSGEQSKTCTLKSNDPAQPSMTIQITCDVMTLVWTDPTMLISLQQPRGQAYRQTINVMSRSDEFALILAETTNPDLTIEVGETTRVWVEDEGRHHFRTPVTVALPADLPLGYANGEVRIVARAVEKDGKQSGADDDASAAGAPRAATNQAVAQADPAQPPQSADGASTGDHAQRDVANELPPLGENEHLLRLPLAVHIVGDINPQPQQLALGALTPGQAFEGSFELHSAGGHSFEIRQVELDTNQAEASVEAEFEPLPDGQAGFRVRVFGVAPQKTGMLRGHIIVRTDAAEEEEKRIPFYGSVRPVG